MAFPITELIYCLLSKLLILAISNLVVSAHFSYVRFQKSNFY